MLCLSHVSYPPVIESKAIEPSIHPTNCVLVFELAVRVVGMFRLFQVVLSYSGWESYHMLYFMDICCWRYSWLTLLLILQIELSRGIGESFCQFYDGSLVSPRTPRLHELF
jgi:hypothetical protein